ncbi:MAG: hypothetical protein NC299_15545 [Lachnospiraceae bacterium]|nr:hypothetical protein [Lachnospiraceae bacterium]
MTLYHYFDRSIGPFRNLSDLPEEEAKAVLEQIKKERPNCMAAERDDQYMERRAVYEQHAYRLFIELGGKPRRKTPHYMVIGACAWLSAWYDRPAFVRIPLERFDPETLSFTYGDMHPTFSPIVTDQREYRKRLYTYPDILNVISKYGMPQDTPPAEGEIGHPYYVEVQVWSDETVSLYRDERFWN